MKKILISAFSLCALLSSCANDEVVVPQPTNPKVENTNKALGVSVGIDTKAIRTGAAFKKDEKIGLFISGVANVADYTAVKKIYTCPESGNWTTDATDAIMLNNKEANVYAFHPETLAPDMAAFTVPVDVKAVQTIIGLETTQIDYLWAKSTTPVSNAVGKEKAVLTFKHALCQLAFIINKHATYVGGSGIASTMQIASKLPASKKLMAGATGKLSLADGTFADLAAVNALEFKPETSNDYFQANATTTSTNVLLKVLVAPQASLVYTGDDMIMIKLTVDGKPMEVALPVGDVQKWDAGMTYTYTLTLKGTDIVVASTNVTITDWTAGGTAVADLN